MDSEIIGQLVPKLRGKMAIKTVCICVPVTLNDESCTDCVEFPAGVVNKDDAAASDDSQRMTKAEERKAVQQLLIESMLKSVQTALKQQQQQTDQQSGQ